MPYARTTSITPSLAAGYSKGGGSVATPFHKAIRPPHSRPCRICLVMIVKDETPVLRTCFDSVVDSVDYWVICDTGSTDGTQAFVRDYFAVKGVPGELHERPWRDFGTNRSEAFDLAHAAAQLHAIDYYFVMDADDEFRGDLNAFQREAATSKVRADAYTMDIELGQIAYTRMLLFAAAREWQFKGVLHEYPALKDSVVNEAADADVTYSVAHCPSALVRAGVHGNRTTSNPNKYRDDAAVLEAALRTDPTNARYTFYLGQSYFDAQDFETALKWYERRVAMGGWAEEVYCSLLQCARCKLNITKDMAVAELDFLRAHRYRPTRLEALFTLVAYYRTTSPQTAYAYGLLGVDAVFQPPQDALFVQKELYRHQFADHMAVCAHLMGHDSLSIRLNTLLIKRHHEGGTDIDFRRVRANLEMSYRRHAAFLRQLANSPIMR